MMNVLRPPECVTSDAEGGQEVGFRGSLLLQGSHALLSAGSNQTDSERKGDERSDGVSNCEAGAAAGYKEERKEAREWVQEEEAGEGGECGLGATERHRAGSCKEEQQGSVRGIGASARIEEEPPQKEANPVHAQEAVRARVGARVRGRRRRGGDPMEWQPPSGDEEDESGLED